MFQVDVALTLASPKLAPCYTHCMVLVVVNQWILDSTGLVIEPGRLVKRLVVLAVKRDFIDINSMVNDYDCDVEVFQKRFALLQAGSKSQQNIKNF